MKKIYYLLLVLLVSGNLKAQMYWLKDMAFAKATAKESGKLIVIDFWASWCGPCDTMDEKLWQSPEMKGISKNFIGLKINIADYRNYYTCNFILICTWFKFSLLLLLNHFTFV